MSKTRDKDVYCELNTMFLSLHPFYRTGGVGKRPSCHRLGCRTSESAQSSKPFRAKNLDKKCFWTLLFSSSMSLIAPICDIFSNSAGHSEFLDAWKVFSWIGVSSLPLHGKKELRTSFKCSRSHSFSRLTGEFRKSMWIPSSVSEWLLVIK